MMREYECRSDADDVMMGIGKGGDAVQINFIKHSGMATCIQKAYMCSDSLVYQCGAESNELHELCSNNPKLIDHDAASVLSNMLTIMGNVHTPDVIAQHAHAAHTHRADYCYNGAE